ncbi:MAG: AarF/ABC1/UbiB kinase family protein [Bradymonadaceae bacterium]|nr:AarF/ABC1/UbiB kinase family protein [Lujinxingiaceae bacterium]
MSEDWDKLAGEQGEEIATSHFKRAFALGSMGARVSASALAGKLGSMVMPASKEKRDAYLEAAYTKNAHRVVEALGKLKGASMKVGQMLSVDPELLPPEFASVMSSLQSQAPPMTYATVKAQIERAFDLPIEDVFSYFDPSPVGAASIGQVHRARLISGEDVAVKVQYPKVAESLESDLKSLRSLLSYGRAVFEKQRLDAYLSEVREVIIQEADYLAEARNLEGFGEVVRAREGLSAPRPYMQWTRPCVLVMEFMEGRPLEEALREMGPGQRRDQLLVRWVDTYAWMFHVCHELHADPHPGNFLLDAQDNLVLLDFGCIKSFDPALTDGFLDVLDACWQNEPARAIASYARMGFGTGSTKESRLEPELLLEYHRIILAPFLEDAPFDFASWSPTREGKLFVLRHPSLLALAPPPQVLSFFRVLSGIKGLLSKMDARLNVYQMAREMARERGRLTLT